MASGPTPARPAGAHTNLLIDLNGTCHVGEHETPDAISALRKLRQVQSSLRAHCDDPKATQQLNIRFCSNTTKESTDSLLSKLRRVGFDESLIDSKDLFTSLDATARYVARNNLSPLLLLSESAQTAFRQRDLEERCVFASATSTPEELSMEAREKLRSCDAVVVGLCPSLMTQAWLDEAFRLVSGEYSSSSSGKKAQLIATHRALYHRPAPDSPLSLGPGAFIAALEAASRLEPTTTAICGKPSRTFLEECIAGMVAEGEGGESPRNIIIGDDVDADLGGDTVTLGLERVLVRTGKYRPGDETRTTSTRAPDATFNTFAQWVDAFVAEIESAS